MIPLTKRCPTAGVSSPIIAACLWLAASGCSDSENRCDFFFPPVPDTASARPYGLDVPSAYDAAEPTPLVIFLHGYFFNGNNNQEWLRLQELREEFGYLYARPTGTPDSCRLNMWNEDDVFSNGQDDIAYLTAIIEDVASRFNLDRSRVFLVGHSMGGAMAMRFACEQSERVAGVVNLAGFRDPCEGTGPVPIAHIYGDKDQGDEFDPYEDDVSPQETIAPWSELNKCTGDLVADNDPVDLDLTIDGNETIVSRFSGCEAPLESWNVRGAGHGVGNFGPGTVASEQFLNFLFEEANR